MIYISYLNKYLISNSYIYNIYIIIINQKIIMHLYLVLGKKLEQKKNKVSFSFVRQSEREILWPSLKQVQNPPIIK